MTSAPTTPTAPPVDPRLAERWAAIAHERGRRRRRVLLTVTAIASILGIAWLVVESPLLALRRIDVRGTAHVSAAELRAAAHVRTGAPLLRVDTGAVARRLRALPWIAAARVERELPHALRIRVTERAPAAWARAGSGPDGAGGPSGAVVVVDAGGRVLGRVPGPPPGLPELVGVRVPDRPGARVVPARATGVLRGLPRVLRIAVGAIVLDGRGTTLRLSGAPGSVAARGSEIRLGTPDALDTKSAAALAVLDALGDTRVHYVDVEVPSAPATG